MSLPGLFVALEGGDGTGKTTQSRLLRDALQERGVGVALTREPGGTGLGDQIREMLLHPARPVAEMAEVLLFAASRAQHVEEVIRPALEDGKVVVCDRFMGSTIVYQGTGLGVPLEQICAANRLATRGVEPDVTIVLDAPVQVALERKRQEPDEPADAIESREQQYHERVRSGYLSLGMQLSGAVEIVDGTQAIEDVHERIASLVLGALKAKGRDDRGV